MVVSRSWATPLAAGAFLISAVTGVLIFFHKDTGLNKVAHEWLSWLLLAGIGVHVWSNVTGFKRHFTSRGGLAVIGFSALVLGFSFANAPGEKSEPPFMASVRALSNAPISTLALVAHVSTEDVRNVLTQEGLHPTSDEQTIGQLAGGDLRARMRLLEKVLTTPAPSAR